jgi:catechol 2,3-dioxygenase-like lactoylglutathione lyase family enzyme
MNIQSLGHVVIKVRNQQRAEAFYNGLLGIPIAARLAAPVMTFLLWVTTTTLQ